MDFAWYNYQSMDELLFFFHSKITHRKVHLNNITMEKYFMVLTSVKEWLQHEIILVSYDGSYMKLTVLEFLQVEI